MWAHNFSLLWTLRPKSALGGEIFSGITTLFGIAVEAERSSEGIFTSSFFDSFLFWVEECPDPMQMRVDSITKLDQKSKVPPPPLSHSS